MSALRDSYVAGVKLAASEIGYPHRNRRLGTSLGTLPGGFVGGMLGIRGLDRLLGKNAPSPLRLPLLLAAMGGGAVPTALLGGQIGKSL